MNTKENFGPMSTKLKRELKEKEVEIEVVDRLKLLTYDRKVVRTKDNNYKKVYYTPNIEQLKDLFPEDETFETLKDAIYLLKKNNPRKFLELYQWY